MKVPVYDLQGNQVEEIELPDKFFSLPFNPDLVHQAMRWQMMNSYFPYAHTKTRAEVRGGGRKPWPQKGTGRARHGSIRSPLWVGGGVTFGPRKEKNRKLKINKKMKRKALFIVLSEKLRRNFLKIFEEFDFQGKTKKAEEFLKKWLQERKTDKKRETVLLVSASENKNLSQAVRNLPYANTISARNLNILSLLNHKYVFLEKEAIEKIINTFKI